MPQGAVPDRYRDLLESTVLGHLATVDPEGRPQVNPVWFLWDPVGQAVLLSIKAETRKLRNLRTNPNVAMSFSDPARPDRYLEIRGAAVELELYDTIEWVNVLARKYTGAEFVHGADGEHRYKVTIRVDLDRARLSGASATTLAREDDGQSSRHKRDEPSVPTPGGRSGPCRQPSAIVRLAGRARLAPADPSAGAPPPRPRRSAAIVRDDGRPEHLGDLWINEVDRAPVRLNSPPEWLLLAKSLRLPINPVQASRQWGSHRSLLHRVHRADPTC